MTGHSDPDRPAGFGPGPWQLSGPCDKPLQPLTGIEADSRPLAVGVIGDVSGQMIYMQLCIEPNQTARVREAVERFDLLVQMVRSADNTVLHHRRVEKIYPVLSCPVLSCPVLSCLYCPAARQNESVPNSMTDDTRIQFNRRMCYKRWYKSNTFFCDAHSF